MRLRSVVGMMVATVVAAGTSWADFKYTQQSKVTGGELVSVTKTLGVFSKKARQVTAPQLSTTMVRGNRLRTEQQATGMIDIIDLDGRRFIHIDTGKKSYWIETFDQFRQRIQQAQEKVKEEQTKAAAKHADPQSVTMVPKFDVQATGETRTVMDVPAKEMKMRVEMLFKSTDSKTEADLEKSNVSYWMSADAWYGTISGYDEVRKFYMKMAKELDWLPGSMGIANPQMNQAADEFKKNAIKMDGMPLIEYTSFGMAATGQGGQGQSEEGQGSAGQGSGQQGQSSRQQPSSSDNSAPTSARGAITKGLGGLFKKKQQQTSDTDANSSASGGSSANNAPPPTRVAGSMMDMTIEVTSYSKDSLDASLFEVPPGYAEVQPAASGQ